MVKGFPRGKALLLLVFAAFAASCTTVNYTANLSGEHNTVSPRVKNFTVQGPIQVQRTETHSAGPLGFVKKVEGSKVTYADLLLEADKLEADDVIDVRIAMTTDGKTTFAGWLTGWTRTFTYTAAALAIKYVNENEAQTEEAPLIDLFRR